MTDLAGKIIEEVKLSFIDKEVHLDVDSPPPAWGDSDLIQEVLLNLFQNAVKYGKKEEVVRIEFKGKTENNETVYAVRDNGIGFDMKYVDKLFGVFQRLHGPDEYEGVGIGLALVQGFLHRHDGRVWAQGKVNEGATFYFALPREE